MKITTTRRVGGHDKGTNLDIADNVAQKLIDAGAAEPTKAKANAKDDDTKTTKTEGKAGRKGDA